MTNFAQPRKGLDTFRSLDLDEGTLEIVKAAPGCVYSLIIANHNAAIRYVKLYDAVSGTAGTGTPKMTLTIPGTTIGEITHKFDFGGLGVQFDTGICIGATTGLADNDTGGPSAGDIVAHVLFK